MLSTFSTEILRELVNNSPTAEHFMSVPATAPLVPLSDEGGRGGTPSQLTSQLHRPTWCRPVPHQHAQLARHVLADTLEAHVHHHQSDVLEVMSLSTHVMPKYSGTLAGAGGHHEEHEVAARVCVCAG
jgi:hypothetical protein